MTLLDDAISAHGGLKRWHEIHAIDVTLRCSGIAMPAKGQPTILRQFKATVNPRRPHVQLHGIGTFDASRPRPAGMARRPRWTTDDTVHFAGYALWGYLAAPFIFAEDDVIVHELPRRRLRVDFPDRIPAHSRRQTFYFDNNAILKRLDCTAEVFLGPLGRVQHRCYAHTWIDGLLIPTRRRVTPRRLPAPTLVSTGIDELQAS
jgi:hypothetical protein